MTTVAAAALEPSVSAGRAGEPQEVDLWLLQDDGQRLAEDAAAPLVSWLNQAERDHCRRYRNAARRRQFICSRALLRYVLSYYRPVAPGGWVFEPDARGKLRLAPPASETGLLFNLSHTQNLIVCAVARDRTVGVDVECSERVCDYGAISQRYFAPAEIQALAILPEAQRKARFFEFWTLKEAYVKALGHGLSYAFHGFHFILTESGIAISDSLDPDANRRWTFSLLTYNDRYRIALCLEHTRTRTESRIVLYSLSINALIEAATQFVTA